MAILTNDKAVQSRAFSVVALKIQATQTKTTKLTTPTVHISPCPEKLDSCSTWGARSAWGALTTFPCKFDPKFFLLPGGCTCTQCTPGNAYGTIFCVQAPFIRNKDQLWAADARFTSICMSGRKEGRKGKCSEI